MKVIKSLSLAIVAILFGAASLFAQVQQQEQQAPPQQQMPELPTSADVSDEEIDQLVTAIIELEPIQIETQEKIEKAVEEEDISFDRFRELMMAMQNPQMADQVDVSDDEMDKIQQLQPKLMEIQGDAEQEMVAKIEENGLTAERYQSILMGAQQDPELRMRVEEVLEQEEDNS